MDSGKPSPVIFSSYSRHNSKKAIVDELVLSGSITDAAEATSAAGTFFPVFITKTGSYTDGGIKYNNPCYVGYTEASLLWPNNVCDMTLSIGTGACNDEKQLQNDFESAIKVIVSAATDSEDQFKLLSRELGDQRCIRLNPVLSTPINLADVSKIPAVRKAVDEIPDSLIEHVCAQLFVSNYYIEPKNDVTPRPNEILVRIACRDIEVSHVFNITAENFDLDVFSNNTKLQGTHQIIRDNYAVRISGLN